MDEGNGTNPAINGANTVTINAAGTDKVTGAASISMAVGYASITLESDGSGKWGVLDNMSLGTQACASHQFVNGVGLSGLTCAQPAFTDISGTASAAQIPVTPTTTGTNVTLTGPRAYYACTGTCTVTLPVPVAGYEFCIRNDDNRGYGDHVGGALDQVPDTKLPHAQATARQAPELRWLVARLRIKSVLLGKSSTHYYVMSSTGT